MLLFRLRGNLQWIIASGDKKNSLECFCCFFIFVVIRPNGGTKFDNGGTSETKMFLPLCRRPNYNVTPTDGTNVFACLAKKENIALFVSLVIRPIIIFLFVFFVFPRFFPNASFISRFIDE